ncbi:MAG TPA: hypothetical protein PLL11_17460, partial [Spirochaetota bacterium]|nr:hypothetical protein [Spirochaetota bacterium]HPG52367.1 hypothetical protein [Spirochaetota bacterium]
LHEFFWKLGNTFEECVKRFLSYEDAYLKRLAVYFNGGSEPADGLHHESTDYKPNMCSVKSKVRMR